jgi:hypothetical protein
MHMRGTRMEKKVEICATNLTNKIKCMSSNANKWVRILWRHVVSTTSVICGVKPEHSRLKPYGNPWRICHVIQIFSAFIQRIELWNWAIPDNLHIYFSSVWLSSMSVPWFLITYFTRENFTNRINFSYNPTDFTANAGTSFRLRTCVITFDNADGCIRYRLALERRQLSPNP